MQQFKRKYMVQVVLRHLLCKKTLIISNKEMNDIMKIAQAHEDSSILLKRVTKTIKNKTKEQKGGF